MKNNFQRKVARDEKVFHSKYFFSVHNVWVNSMQIYFIFLPIELQGIIYQVMMMPQVAFTVRKSLRFTVNEINWLCKLRHRWLTMMLQIKCGRLITSFCDTAISQVEASRWTADAFKYATRVFWNLNVLNKIVPEKLKPKSRQPN